MSDQDGGDRPRWEGFPGGVDPDQPAGDPGAAAQPPVEPTPAAPQFPVQPMSDETAPIPVVGTAPIDPSGSGLGPRRSRSQAAAPRRDTSRVIALACAAAVVLVGAGFAFVACNNDDVTPAGTAPIVPLASPTSVSPTASSTLPSSSAIPTSSASTTARPSSSASASASGDAEPSPTASSSPSATAAPVKQPVTVLNSTGITGLAKRVAADIENGGWTVTKTANWKGAQPSETTIYYLPGAKNKASAKLFAKKFDVAQAVKPALPGMTSNLTLVLTRDAT